MNRLVTSVLLAVLVTSLSFGAAVLDQVAKESGMPIRVEQLSKSDTHMELGLSVDEPHWMMVGEAGNEAEMINYYLSGATREIGKPVVPISGRMFRLPPQAGVVVDVISAEYETYTDVDYAAYLGEGLDEVFGQTDNPVDEWYPGELAKVGEPAIFHDFRVSNLTTFPVQVNTARREVRVYSNIRVNIRFEGTDMRNALSHWPTRISEAFLPAYRLIMDWDENELDEYELYRGHVQVVMRDDDALWTAMADWFEWKRQRGWVLDFLTDDDVNWTYSNIQNELEDRYEDADPKFDYVVIIGDDTGSFSVPPGSGSGYGAGDQPYSELAGNDNLSDVGVGRISVASISDIQKYVAKVFNYEKEPYMDETDWYLRGMVNRSDSHAGVSKIMMLRYFRHAMLDLGYTQVDTSWNQGNGAATTRINNGVSFYGARGYLGTGLSCSDINNLNNDYMTPVVIDVTCGTGNWSNNTGINECYMRAGTVSVPRGGVCGMSMATSGTSPHFNNCISGGAGWAMLQLDMPTLGDMMYMSKVNGWMNYHGHEDNGLNTFMKWFNLMGDPLIWTWVSVPQELTVDVVEDLDLGQNSIDVEVFDADGAIAGALVTFYKYSGGEEIQVTKKTDAAGMVTLEVSPRESGDAMVTVIKRHYAPVQVEVDVADPASRVGWTEITYVDDGSEGTDGDGDGVPEAGETVGLEMELKNYGTSTASNIEVTASTEEEWITSLSGSVTLTSLAADAEATAEGVILVEIDPEAQNDWILHLDLTAETSVGDFDDACEVTVNAPAYGFVQLNINGSFDPGDVSTATIQVRNIGGGDASASEAWLFSNDPFVQVVNGSDDLPAMLVDQTATGSFTLEAHESAIPGYVGWISMEITTNDGNIDTLGIPVQVGERSPTDPNGPDNYGYFAFDNTDTEYGDFAPTYDWVEINPDVGGNDFNGTSLNLSDPTENDDEGATVDLPFDVQYYGNTFDEISITTNGYAAFGRNADIALARNWTIPSPLGPNNMLAVYWDELRTTGSSDILYYHDAQNGRFIVEWYDMKHHNPSNSGTFQLIIYDQEVRPTWTGDNDILFQYHDVDHSTNGTSYPLYDTPWWTTGIENQTQSDGILIAYWNEYTAGSADIEDEHAILFTTNIPLIVGHIEGTITAAGSGDPVENAWIGTEDGLFETVSDTDGYFFLENVMIGPVSFNIEADCYNNMYDQVLTVVESETLNVDFELNHPEFAVAPLAVSDTLAGDDEATHSVYVYNPGNGVMNWDAHFDFEPDVAVNGKPGTSGGEKSTSDELDEPWDQIYNFDLDENESQHRGIEFDGFHFWVAGSNNYDITGPNKLYKYTPDGELVGVYNQPVPSEDRSSQGFFGLHWDGDYLYGADSGIMYQMQFDAQSDEWAVVSTFEIPANPARYIVKNPDTGEFIVGDYGTEIRVVHPDSAGIIREYGQEFMPRGASWYPEDEDGYDVYFIGFNNGADFGEIIKMHPETGDTMLVSTFAYEGATPSGACMSYLWNPQVWMFASVMDGGQQDHVQLWEVSQFNAWIHMITHEGTVAPGDSQLVEFELTAADLPPNDYEIYVRFDHDACIAEDNFVHIVMTVPDLEIDEEDLGAARPLEWAFEGAYPNPFNPSTTVAFSLKHTADVQLRVYNLLGQEVMQLVNRPMQAGRYQVTFDGSQLSSGIYFLHLNAGPMQETRKVILMK